MRKKEHTTLQMKLGFQDEDIKKPDHDQMIKWLDKNISNVLSDIYNISPDWRQADIDALKMKANKTIENAEAKLIEERETLLRENRLEWRAESKKYGERRITEIDKIIEVVKKWNGIPGEIPQKKGFELLEKQWEYPISTRSSNYNTGYTSSKYIIGYVDLKVVFTYYRLAVHGMNLDNSNGYISTGDIYWIQTNQNKNLSNEINKHTVFFEAKTKLGTLGEVFRQLNTYKEYSSGDYVILCPDDSEREIIKEQGYLFYKFGQ